MTSKEVALEKCDGANGTTSIGGSSVKLRRELGLFSAVNLILGVMIGSGIFVSPSSALEHSGSVGLCLIIWTVSGIISLLGALSFAELGTVLGKSGAEYSYFQEAFGNIHKYWGPLPSFICAWIYVVILRPAEVAIIVMTFAEYAIQPFTPDLEPNYKDTAIKLTSLAALYCSVRTKDVLSQELRSLRERSVHICKAIESSPNEVLIPNKDKTLKYVAGLRKELETSNTTITTDNNLITSQFLSEMKERTEDVEKHIAFTKGLIHDADTEIERLQNLVITAKEVRSSPIVEKKDIQPQHIEKAKEKFHVLKQELRGLIYSLFPKCSGLITEVLAELMRARLDVNSNGYIPCTAENFPAIELLMDANLVIVMTYINITSVKLFVKVQNIFGICKVFACLIVIGGGIYEISKGNTYNLSKGFEGSTTSPGGIALALYSGLWAYDGWNSVTVVTEEIINPGVNVPLSISIAVPLITGLYVFMNVAYMTVLSYAEMTSVPAVAVAFGARVLGPAAFLIPLGVAIATFGCAMSVQFGVTRVCYTAARGGHMLEVFSYVNLKRLTPAPAVALQALLTSVFILVGNIRTLIEFASWFLWFFYGLAMVALLVLRRTQADKPRPYRVPTLVPCFVLVVAIFLSILPIVHDPSVKYLMAIGFIVLGVGVYTVFVYYRKTPTAFLRKFTFLTQVLFESVPPNDHQD
ncbi:B(0,+)-type amino acid transporter 1 [Papilio xuthus]|uniref:B(0,+)-type amino acid transporter 1 n=1 Tax=Papilio xuthus TaxID=66420 RepID=A0A194PVV8_PAPXU|nr:B(0,+)-type amino acid transporter 1 [Papilio xuthus]